MFCPLLELGLKLNTCFDLGKEAAYTFVTNHFAMKKRFALILLFFSLCALPQLSFAQAEVDSTRQLYVVIKSNGTEYICHILSDDGREVLIETDKLGKVYIPKADIKEIRPLQQKKDLFQNKFSPNNPFTTRYSFTTNALPVNKGENYYQLNLYGPEFHFAVTDRLNLGVMSSWLGSPIAFAAKYTIPTQNPKLNFSVGTIMANSGYIMNFSRFGGLHFGNVTFGDRDNNLTLAAGILHWHGGSYELMAPGDYSSNMSFSSIPMRTIKNPALVGPMFSVAGIARIGVKTSFVFDSMLGYFRRDFERVDFINVFNGSNSQWTRRVTPRIEQRETLAFFMMPGMRVQKNEEQAFQFSLAGISVRQTIDGQVDAFSFPIPFCTWFFTF